MSFTVFDRVKESSSTTGTGAITLSGAASNYVTFNTGVGLNNFTWYCINNLSANEWEVGYGQLTGATTLTRISVTAGTNGTSFVNFSAGTKEVFVTQPSAFNNQTLGRTNIIINPHGSIQQETTTPVTVLNGNYFADQWICFKVSSTGVLQAGVTSDRSVSSYDASHLWIKTTTAQGSLAAGDNSGILQPFEGNYIRRLFYGTSAAKGSWLRWRASSSQSGTASVAIRNGANNRCFVQSFAVTTTPTDYFLYVPGDTTGTWPTDNTQGANLVFTHSAGTNFQTSTLGAWQAGNFIAANTQSNMMDTVNRQLNVTDVQWSQSAVLLPFEPIDYVQELLKCQRYLVVFGAGGANCAFGTGQAFASTDAWIPIALPTPMRPSISVTHSAAGDFRLLSSGGASLTVTGVGVVAVTDKVINTSAAVAGGLTGGNATVLHSASASAKITVNARF